MVRSRLALSYVVLAWTGQGCDAHDIGKPCPQLLGGAPTAESGGTRVETLEVVEQNAAFPCDELICIATDGRPGYCSRKCREDAGCPAGFECRQVQRLGDFAQVKFCAWKPCRKRADCGSADEFRCVAAPSADVGEELRLCDFQD